MKKHFLVFGLFLFTFTLVAQNRSPYNSVPFLKLSPDARAAGMGDAGVATSPDANSMFHNNAKMVFAKKKMAGAVNYTPWLRDITPDMSLFNLSGYTQYDDKQAFGLAMTYFNLGSIDFRTNTGASAGTFLSREFNLTGGYARKLSKNFSMGINMRYIYSNLAGSTTINGITTKPGQAIASDINAYYQKDFRSTDGEIIEWALGLTLSNIGSKMTYGEPSSSLPKNLQVPNYLPATLKIGSSLGYHLDDHNKITLAVDIDKLMTPTPPIVQKVAGQWTLVSGEDPNRTLFNSIFTSFNDAPDGASEEFKEVMLSMGAEYSYNNLFAIRGGYHYENISKGGRTYFTAGMGAKIQERYGLDFSYLMPFSSGNPLANTFRLSMVFDVEKKDKQDKITE